MNVPSDRGGGGVCCGLPEKGSGMRLRNLKKVAVLSRTSPRDVWTNRMSDGLLGAKNVGI